MSQLPEIQSIRTDAVLPQPARKRSLTKHINLPLLITTVLLCSYGLLIVYSAIVDNPDYSFMRQLQGVVIGLVAMYFVARFDYRALSDYTWLLLAINVILILSPFIPGLGVEVNGAMSWIKIGSIQIQPGEFAKLTVILLSASMVARYNGKLDEPIEYLKALGVLLVPFVCAITHDLGTGLVYLFIAITALVVGGAKWKYLLISLIVGIALIAGLLVIDEMIFSAAGEYKILKYYQRARLLVFIDQSYAQSTVGYNLEQAKIAIGSGGLFGKGLFNASQTALGFLPEAPTDFIFCVLAEQLGFFGVLLLLGLYIALVLICFHIARRSSDLFGALIVMSIVGMWLFQILENIGMTCGLMPITGIPLPFMSYGSSFMLVNFVLLGLIHSVWARTSN